VLLFIFKIHAGNCLWLMGVTDVVGAWWLCDHVIN